MSGKVVRGPWPGITAATRRPGVPPPLAYYAARIDLGMPSHADALLRACPWCFARVGQSCYVRANGRRTKFPHEARIEVTP